jgi:hypothetical protein
MTYPLSSEVSSGQPTAAVQYNNLRRDALRLGQADADAATMADFLWRFSHNLRLEALESDRLRVPATLASPVALMVNGCMLTASANVDLSASGKPSGAAADWYVFAVQSSASASFTLEVNTSASEASGRCLIGQFYWDGSRIAPGSVQCLASQYLEAVLGRVYPPVFQGRLSLSSGTPVTSSDVTAAGTVYLTPFSGDLVELYVSGRGWRPFELSEVSVSLSGVVTGKNVDLFLYHDGSSLAMEKAVWTSDSVRASALATQNGRQVKSGDASRLYVGTCRTSGLGMTEDSAEKRWLWNVFNQVPRFLFKGEDAVAYAYTGSTWRAANDDSGNRLDILSGLPASLHLWTHVLAKTYTTCISYSGIGCASTTVNSAQSIGCHYAYAPGNSYYRGATIRADLLAWSTPGLQAYTLLEKGNGAVGNAWGDGDTALNCLQGILLG